MDLIARSIIDRAALLFNEIDTVQEDSRVDVINSLRRMLHIYSPMKAESVDCIVWVRVDEVKANDYNPNSVAPPEMKLLEHSIAEDGYTQPIVAWKTEEGHRTTRFTTACKWRESLSHSSDSVSRSVMTNVADFGCIIWELYR